MSIKYYIGGAMGRKEEYCKGNYSYSFSLRKGLGSLAKCGMEIKGSISTIFIKAKQFFNITRLVKQNAI